MSDPRSLIITNGSSGISAIQQTKVDSVLNGTIISWDDVLHEGPVPNEDPRSLLKTRASFLSQDSEQESAEIESTLVKRNEYLLNRDLENPLFLCFEHDLYDQLQLVQILQLCLFYQKVDKIFLIQSDNYLSEMDSQELRALFDNPVLLNKKDFELAQRFWAGFTADEPHPLVFSEDSDLQNLPFLSSALNRLYLLYPSARDGMSLEERLILEIILERREIGFKELFKSYQQRETAKFLGDRFFMHRVKWMLESSLVKLVDMTLETSDREQAAKVGEINVSLWRRKILLTELGQQVAGGELSLLDLGLRKRWIGGVHINDQNSWKWDVDSGVFTR